MFYLTIILAVSQSSDLSNAQKPVFTKKKKKKYYKRINNLPEKCIYSITSNNGVVKLETFYYD